MKALDVKGTGAVVAPRPLAGRPPAGPAGPGPSDPWMSDRERRAEINASSAGRDSWLGRNRGWLKGWRG